MQQEINGEILQLTQTICRLHLLGYINAQQAVEILKVEGFGEVAVEYVEAVYKQRSKHIEERVKPWRQNAEKSLYWANADHAIIIWSERYLLYEQSSWNSPNESNHEINVVDVSLICYLHFYESFLGNLMFRKARILLNRSIRWLTTLA
jgi:hypothetical protein